MWGLPSGRDGRTAGSRSYRCGSEIKRVGPLGLGSIQKEGKGVDSGYRERRWSRVTQS